MCSKATVPSNTPSKSFMLYWISPLQHQEPEMSMAWLQTQVSRPAPLFCSLRSSASVAQFCKPPAQLSATSSVRCPSLLPGCSARPLLQDAALVLHQPIGAACPFCYLTCRRLAPCKEGKWEEKHQTLTWLCFTRWSQNRGLHPGQWLCSAALSGGQMIENKSSPGSGRHQKVLQLLDQGFLFVLTDVVIFATSMPCNQARRN